jgi:copper chaperone CopZ
MSKLQLKVKGMHCRSCEMLITEVLEEAGAKNVEVSHKTGDLSLETNLSVEKVKELIKKEGYETQG